MVRCKACERPLTEQHFAECKWIPCRCGHSQQWHTAHDGCGWCSGRGLRCPCEGFAARITYDQFVAESEEHWQPANVAIREAR